MQDFIKKKLIRMLFVSIFHFLCSCFRFLYGFVVFLKYSKDLDASHLPPLNHINVYTHTIFL
jgi:hypothetical protein